ncbi:GntR family transcriptional regulator [Glutamicibacter arilaitensis]|uniref:GntR family transcriptional regulator n=1 Tax=Glutamicibacter arilaitensis TaxID=256701 RepID=UPI00384ACEE1
MSVNETYSSIPLGSGSTHAHTSAWVASTLRQEIANGRLLPGSKLSEQALSEALGVSRNTLREGFTLLDSELIITRIPNRGVFVSSPSAEDIREIYAVRRAIEPAALAWGPALDVPALAQAILEARAAAEVRDVPGMADANQRFHEAVVRSTGSVHLLELMGRILAKMRLVFHSMSDAPDFHSHYVERNAALVDLLASGQRNEAAQTLLGYLDTAEAELLEHYESSQKI